MNLKGAVDNFRRKQLYQRMLYNVNSDPDIALHILEQILLETNEGTEFKNSLGVTPEYMLELAAFASTTSREVTEQKTREFLASNALQQTLAYAEVQQHAAKAIKSLEDIYRFADRALTVKNQQIAVPAEVLNKLISAARPGTLRSTNPRVNELVWNEHAPDSNG